jgi:hypothetical protein
LSQSHDIEDKSVGRRIGAGIQQRQGFIEKSPPVARLQCLGSPMKGIEVFIFQLVDVHRDGSQDVV